MESYQIAEVVQTLIVSGAVLGALSIAAWAWVQRRASLGSKDVQRLTTSLSRLEEGMARLHDDVMEVSERLEFTERLLSRAVEGAEQKGLHKP